MGVLPIDPGMTAGDHGLLHVDAVGVQLSDSAPIAIGGDTAHCDGLASEEPAQVIPGSCCRCRLGVLPAQLRRVDASQPDAFAVGRPAGVAVVAAADRHAGSPGWCSPGAAQQGSGDQCGGAPSHRGGFGADG